MSSPFETPPPRSERGLVLASSSPYRQALLEKLGVEFQAASPRVDESSLADETAQALCVRLGLQKARALAARFPHHLIIGSDQVAELDGKRLGKPETRARAMGQLTAASGNTVIFYTSVCLLDTVSGVSRWDMDTTTVRFRALSAKQIARYLDREDALDCAGSFKSEGLGIALMEKLETEDPNALVGLPLIRLIRLLQGFGVAVL
jgi:septum formation protein